MKLKLAHFDTVKIIIRGGRGPRGLPGIDAQGTPGSSAYQIALDNGFVGSEVEWLESLEGAASTVPGPPGGMSYRYGGFAADNILDGEILLDHVVTRAHILPDNFAGCKASIGDFPASMWTGVIQKNGATIGTLSITAAGLITWNTIGLSVTLAIGDVITLIAPGEAVPGLTRLRYTFEGIV